MVPVRLVARSKYFSGSSDCCAVVGGTRTNRAKAMMITVWSLRMFPSLS